MVIYENQSFYIYFTRGYTQNRAATTIVVLNVCPYNPCHFGNTLPSMVVAKFGTHVVGRGQLSVLECFLNCDSLTIQ